MSSEQRRDEEAQMLWQAGLPPSLYGIPIVVEDAISSAPTSHLTAPIQGSVTASFVASVTASFVAAADIAAGQSVSYGRNFDPNQVAPGEAAVVARVNPIQLPSLFGPGGLFHGITLESLGERQLRMQAELDCREGYRQIFDGHVPNPLHSSSVQAGETLSEMLRETTDQVIAANRARQTHETHFDEVAQMNDAADAMALAMSMSIPATAVQSSPPSSPIHATETHFTEEQRQDFAEQLRATADRNRHEAEQRWEAQVQQRPSVVSAGRDEWLAASREAQGVYSGRTPEFLPEHQQQRPAPNNVQHRAAAPFGYIREYGAVSRYVHFAKGPRWLEENRDWYLVNQDAISGVIDAANHYRLDPTREVGKFIDAMFPRRPDQTIRHLTVKRIEFADGRVIEKDLPVFESHQDLFRVNFRMAYANHRAEPAVDLETPRRIIMNAAEK